MFLFRCSSRETVLTEDVIAAIMMAGIEYGFKRTHHSAHTIEVNVTSNEIQQ